MKKVKVIIEEHYTKEIEIGIPDCVCKDSDERIVLAEKIVKDMYDSGDIIMNKDDYNGNTLIMAEDVESGSCDDWTQYITDDTIRRAKNKNSIYLKAMKLGDFIEKAPIEDVEKLLKRYNIKFTESKDEESNNDYASIWRLPEFDDEIEVPTKIHEIKEDDWDSVIEKIKNDECENEDEYDEIGRFCDMYPFPLHDDFSGHTISISDIKNNINKPEEDDWDEIIRKIKKY